MVIILTLIGLLYGVAFGALLGAAYNAPEGFEDESGFRYGRQEGPVAAQAGARRDVYKSEARTNPSRRYFNLHAI